MNKKEAERIGLVEDISFPGATKSRFRVFRSEKRLNEPPEAIVAAGYHVTLVDVNHILEYIESLHMDINVHHKMQGVDLIRRTFFNHNLSSQPNITIIHGASKLTFPVYFLYMLSVNFDQTDLHYLDQYVESVTFSVSSLASVIRVPNKTLSLQPMYANPISQTSMFGISDEFNQLRYPTMKMDELYSGRPFRDVFKTAIKIVSEDITSTSNRLSYSNDVDELHRRLESLRQISELIHKYASGSKVNMSDEFIILVYQLSLVESYGYFYSTGRTLDPDNIEILRTLATRMILFRRNCRILNERVDFEGGDTSGYTRHLISGHGDMMNERTIYEFKVSYNGFKNENVVQAIIYALIGIASGLPKYRNIESVALYNLMLGEYIHIDLKDVDSYFLMFLMYDSIGMTPEQLDRINRHMERLRKR